MGTFNIPKEEVIYLSLNSDVDIDLDYLECFKDLAIDIECLSNLFEVEAKVEYGYYEGAYIIPKISRIYYSYEIININDGFSNYIDDYIECDLNIFEISKSDIYNFLIEDVKTIKENLKDYEYVTFDFNINDYLEEFEDIKSKIDEFCIKHNFVLRAVGGWVQSKWDFTKEKEEV